ncbi:hypothetical protein C2G38_2289060 [Gigaspora rosea]|uniref:Uncharacterized protein n=1 Tax=Gigaspora rosea TaxID=44941 RepID=A0A397W5I1_9GLOM|nr:hypothetical protein C2G38_2289060 [Gigaspora rosea]
MKFWKSREKKKSIRLGLRSTIRRENDLPKRRDSICSGGKKYEENLDDTCRLWLLRVKNHMNSKEVKRIKDAQSNCAMDRNSNENPKPKSSGKDDRKLVKSCCNMANKSTQEENSSDSTELMLQMGDDVGRIFLYANRD